MLFCRRHLLRARLVDLRVQLRHRYSHSGCARYTTPPQSPISRPPQVCARPPVFHCHSTLGWTSLILVAGSGLLLYYAGVGTPQSRTPEERERLQDDNWDEQTSEEDTMLKLRGRPDHLTDDQEMKLQELWRAAFKVFGVRLLDGSGSLVPMDGVVSRDFGAPENGSNDQQGYQMPAHLPKSPGQPEDKQKAKRGFLGLKKKDKNGKPGEKAEGDEHEDMPNGSATDDKYGETAGFHAAVEHNSSSTLRTKFWQSVQADDPDALMLRFLRARKWDVQKALVMMVSALDWSLTQMKVEELMSHGEAGFAADEKSSDSAAQGEGKDYMSLMRMGKSYMHGKDKEGRPCCVVRVRLHKAGEHSESSTEKATVAVIETARLMLEPPTDTVTVIFDMTDFSMSNMDYTPVKFMIKCFEANYPECLGHVLVHKSPWIFQGIWKIIRGWLDPVVAAKVHFTNSAKDLSQYISTTMLPKEVGGDEDWVYKYHEPEPGENDKMEDTETRDQILAERQDLIDDYTHVTMEWLSGGLSVSDTIYKKRRELARQFRPNYWKLDPYVRAKTIYDRTGVIQPGGIIYMLPSEALKQPPPTNGGPAGPEHKPGDLD